MATTSGFYKYFSSGVTVSTGDTTVINDWNYVGMGLEDIVNLSYDVVNSFSRNQYDIQDQQGAIAWSTPATNMYYSVPTKISKGEFNFLIKFYDERNTTYEGTFEAYVYFNSNGKRVDYDKASVIQQLTDELEPGIRPAGFYFTAIYVMDTVFYLTNNSDVPLYVPGNAKNFLQNSQPFGTTFSLNKGDYLRDIIITLTPVAHVITYDTKEITFRNLNSDGTSYKLTESTALTCDVTVSNLETLKAEASEFGKPNNYAPSHNISQANHQDFIKGNGEKFWNDRESLFIYHRVFDASANTSTAHSFLYALTGQTLPTTTCTFSWSAENYEFYRDSGYSQPVEAYNTFNITTASTINIYPKQEEINIVETINFCLYDIDEGYCSCLSKNILVPPTDMIIQYDATAEKLRKRTKYTYNFSYMDDRDGFRILRSNEDSPFRTRLNANDIPYAADAKIGVIVYTGHTRTLPVHPAKIRVSGKNTVTIGNNGENNDNVYITSVRYHVADSIRYMGERYNFLEEGPIYISYGHSARTSTYYIGVKKNDLEFINNITQYNGTWKDTFGGITYRRPIAYANKMSTMDDLFDKITCYHSSAIELSDNEGWAPNSLYNLKWNAFKVNIWDQYIKYNYNGHNSIKWPGFRRYITYDSETIYEGDGAVRWKNNYPCFDSYDDPSFNYLSGLVVKHPALPNGLIEFFEEGDANIEEEEWNGLLTSTTSYTRSGIIGSMYVNGLFDDDYEVNYTFGSVNVADDWNFNRRGVSDYTQYYLNGSYNHCVNVYEYVREWIYTDQDQFDGEAQGNCDRFISGEGYHSSKNIFKQATNSILYKKTYDAPFYPSTVTIAGIKWAAFNVGAINVFDYGYYFQWGDTKGYPANKVGVDKTFNWANYIYGDGTNDLSDGGISKYNNNEDDGKTILGIEDDPAYAAYGGNWRTPTRAELVALGNAVTTAWTSNYMSSGVAGVICTDKTDSSKVLFFPAAGVANNNSVSYKGSRVYIWSSQRKADTVENSFMTYINSSSATWGTNNTRNRGYCIRAICDDNM